MTAGMDNLIRLGLNTESSLKDDIEDMRRFPELMTSMHAPVLKGDVRLNFGATDDDFRQMSIDEMLAFIDMARQFPNVKKVNMHPCAKQWLVEAQVSGRYGDYDRQIDGIRQIADYARTHGLEIVIENNNAHFTGIGDEVPLEEIDWSNRNQAFGASPEEWIRICEDVDRPNVGLCLDSSHICTYAHTFADPERRREVVMAFVSRPELIRHVHWNDNYLYDARGRADSHALLGKGSLPVELHRTIKALDATILIEHFYTIEDLEEELEYIDRL